MSPTTELNNLRVEKMEETRASERDSAKNSANNNENNVVVIKKHVDRLEPKSEIVKFFTGRNVFITGGSGYLGRVLIFKLLVSCPGIGKVRVCVCVLMLN